MAGIFRRQGRAEPAAVLALALLFGVLMRAPASAQLFDRPVLAVDPGMHTVLIRSVAVDAAGRLAVTGSEDKTARVWSLADGTLLQTIRMPGGPDNIGKIYAIALSPDGALVAVGGWMRGREDLIYLFDTHTGRMMARIGGRLETVHSLAFSPNGRYLAAGLGGTPGGLHVYDADRQWSEVFSDTDYGDRVQGIAFTDSGQLAAASYDGTVKLYSSAFKPAGRPRKAAGELFGISFRPDGAVLAVGHADSATVDLLDGRSLHPLPGPDVGGLTGNSLANVAWSKDGKVLYAGGGVYRDDGQRLVLVWGDAGRGERRALPAGNNTVTALAALAGGQFLVAGADPLLALLEPDGTPRWKHNSPNADFRRRTLAVSADGTAVDFGFDLQGNSLRFDVSTTRPQLVPVPPPDQRTAPAKHEGLAIARWLNDPSPTLDDKPIVLKPHETSRSLAVHPDGGRFVLGADWTIRAIDENGKQLWQRDTPGVAWAVNITADGRLTVAAYGDGTIRWHRMDDGRELLALYVLEDRQNWVAWTPEGFYGATPGAFGVLRWQVNEGIDAAAQAVPVSAIPGQRRPEALALVLQEMDIVRALGIADLRAARRDVQVATGAAKPPGARLHVLTVGVSDYGAKAANLKLKFAHRDAYDVANALLKTQERGGLYAEVKLTVLRDGEASKTGMFDALDNMARNMKSGAGQDLAVVMFSGHGTIIDNQFYLVPYGVDSSTPARLEASAIPATQFQSRILKLAEHGRVLVLLDACRSAGLIGGGGPGALPPAADMLRQIMSASNVTVLTSSSADKLSREDEKWGHGALTKVLLDGLSGDADIDADHNGVISMDELTAFLGGHLSQLTGGDQQLGLDQRFFGDIFVTGL